MPEESFAVYSLLAGYLPDYHYVPTGIGFCLYVKLPVLEQLGVFDDTYSPGYQEENDLIMRGNGRYRVAHANHAYVYHLGSASFSTRKADLDKRNLASLASRYPHFLKRVDSYLQSEHSQAELLLSGLLTDSAGRWDLLLDLSAAFPQDGHAARVVNEIAVRAAEQWMPWFNVFVTGSPENSELLQLRQANLDESRCFAIAVRFGLPRGYEQVATLSGVAFCNVYAVLDPLLPDLMSCGTLSLSTLTV